MTSKYWIKMYHETLHDRKIATLDDHLWRRFVETLLLAGENNDDGFLPPLTDMAWTLRTSEEQLETDLNELIRVGVLEYREGAYFVRNFAKRQEPMPKAEYMRRRREEEQRQEHYQERYQTVTVGNTESDTDKETDTDKDIEEERSACHDFDEILDWLTELTGLPPAGEDDINAVRELAELGIYKADIRGALDWRKQNNVKPARRIPQLKDGIITNRNKRIQESNARAPAASNNNRPRKNAGTLAAARARLEAESGN